MMYFSKSNAEGPDEDQNSELFLLMQPKVQTEGGR